MYCHHHFPQVQPPSELKLVEASKVFSSDSSGSLGREDTTVDVVGASDVSLEDPTSADTEAPQAKRDRKHSGTAHATTLENSTVTEWEDFKDAKVPHTHTCKNVE